MSEKGKYNYRRILGSLLWATLGLATVVLLGAAMNLKASKRCKAIEINISGVQNNYFIDKKEIQNILETICGGTLAGKTLQSFNLSAIENTLRKDQWIRSAELFFDNNDVLRINVSEREPVARIFTNAGYSFYTDTALARLPLSEKFSARVPVFTNFPNNTTFTKSDSNLLSEIKNIGSYILNHPFWMAQIDQVEITPNRTFEMIPKIGNHVISFGNAFNYEEKFDNLLIFYKQVASKVGWNKYSRINVEYKDQVVAVKRGAEDILQDSLRVKQIMQMIVLNAQKHANDSINNIQFDQPKDDNVIPVATQVDDLPDEQTTNVKPITATPNSTIQPSTEKPTPNLIVNPAPEKAIVPEVVKVPESATVSEKKIAASNAKPFWFLSAVKPSKIIKRKEVIKNISPSNEKPNPIPTKKPAVKTSLKIVNKPAAKAIKPPTKTIAKPIIKPATKKAVTPPNNDY